MAKSYKLTEEIKQFIIQQKILNPKLSCRDLIPLIKEHFQVNLSKSIINNVIKENNLSGPIGRRRVKEPESVPAPLIFKPSIPPITALATEMLKKEKEDEFILPLEKGAGFMENGGYFFLKAADLKLSLTSLLAENLAVYFPNLSPQAPQESIEALIYLPFFKHKESLWWLIGKEISSESLEQYFQQLAQIPLVDLNQVLAKLGFNYNLNEINELHKVCLLELNAYVQINFFPPVYEIFDLSTMQERFYGLAAKMEKKANLLTIQLCYPSSFSWANDIVWQGDLSYAARKVSKAKIFTKEGEQIWMNPQLLWLDNLKW